ncbi:MAG: sodium:glutamate symporter [Bacteroidales bacterium]|nr:sodium:glutamate symporter [Bacteroidales bacterium]
MGFTPWTFFIDLGLVSVLLLLGKLIRTKVSFIQKLFIPPSLLAGFMGLILGPEVLGWIPLSGNCGTYSAILIAVVFACIPLTSSKKKGKGESSVGRMFAYSNSAMLLQWALGAAVGLWVFTKIWPGIPDAFGITMPTGFCGGHGTAAAMGDAFGDVVNKDGGIIPGMTTGEIIFSVAMTCATVGIISAVVIGLAMIKWGTNHGKTSFIQKFSDLPDDLRTGILPKDKRDSMGEATFSAISLDSLTFNFGTLMIIVLAGKGISDGIRSISHDKLVVPVFICAFLVALLVRKIFDATKLSEHISPKTVNHISGSCTDYLVAFGVAAIKLKVVWELIVPIVVIIAIGLIFTFLFVVLLGPRVGGKYWFEKMVFTWGWCTGTMSMSIALLRILDPDMKTGTLDDYAYAYVYVAPVEIAIVSLAPLAFLSGYGWLYVCLTAAGGIATLVFAKAKGWLKKID